MPTVERPEFEDHQFQRLIRALGVFLMESADKKSEAPASASATTADMQIVPFSAGSSVISEIQGQPKKTAKAVEKYETDRFESFVDAAFSTAIKGVGWEEKKEPAKTPDIDPFSVFDNPPPKKEGNADPFASAPKEARDPFVVFDNPKEVPLGSEDLSNLNPYATFDFATDSIHGGSPSIRGGASSPIPAADPFQPVDPFQPFRYDQNAPQVSTGERHSIDREDDQTVLSMMDQYREEQRRWRHSMINIVRAIIDDLRIDNSRIMNLVRHFEGSRRSP